MRWLPIPCFPDYEVSDDGGFRSYRISGQHDGRLRRVVPKEHSGSADGDGYTRIALRGPDGARTKMGLHAAVLRAFAGPPGPGEEASHLNGVKTDNRRANLKWETSEQNNARKAAHGTIARGVRLAQSKLDPDRVRSMRALRLDGWNWCALGRQFGVSRSTARSVCLRWTWRHVE